MNDQQIAQLFGLFAGDDTLATDYAQVLEMAKQAVEQRLILAESATDPRLCFLAAAVAHLRYVEITAARDRTAATFAGTIVQNTDAAQKLAFARHLVAAYETLCRDLLWDETFVFQAIPDQGEEA